MDCVYLYWFIIFINSYILGRDKYDRDAHFSKLCYSKSIKLKTGHRKIGKSINKFSICFYYLVQNFSIFLNKKIYQQYFEWGYHVNFDFSIFECSTLGTYVIESEIQKINFSGPIWSKIKKLKKKNRHPIW